MPRCADTSCQRFRLFGALQFNGNWYCSRGCVEQAALAGLDEPVEARRPHTRAGLPPMKLGVLLRHAGAITEAQLETALAAKAHSGLRIGEQLEQLGYVGSESVVRALATQAGVSFFSNFDIARVTRAPGSLPSSMVRALGLVPFDGDTVARRLRVLSAAPLSRAAIRAMAKLSGWQVDVYLVSDAVLEAALDAYQPAEPMPVSHEADTVRTVGAAAARVAERAQRDRAVTMQHVAYDDYVWVRVEGSERVSDLLIAKEATCQAAYTAL